jgi:cellobiose phosphorylase
LHSNGWFLIALAKAAESQKALDLLQIINPIHSCVRNADTYKVEPYVLAEFIYGEESDKFGEGSFTWVTGSAEWFLRGILDYFLGIRPEYDHLVFEPKVPRDWVFSVEREFQGKRYRAEYKKGRKSLKSIS